MAAPELGNHSNDPEEHLNLGELERDEAENRVRFRSRGSNLALWWTSLPGRLSASSRLTRRRNMMIKFVINHWQLVYVSGAPSVRSPPSETPQSWLCPLLWFALGSTELAAWPACQPAPRVSCQTGRSVKLVSWPARAFASVRGL